MRSLRALSLFSSLSAAIFGQSFASLSGTVADPTSANIFGAAVEITNTATGINLKTAV